MRRAFTLTATAAVAALLLSLLTPAGGSAFDPAAPAGHPASPPGTDEVGSHNVVLLTGDQVTLQVAPDGHTTYEVTPGPGRSPVFEAYGSGADLFVVPDDVTGAIAAGALELDLFNVRELVRQGFSGDDPALPVILTYDGTSGRSLASSVAGADRGARELSSIDAVAIRVGPAEAGEVWSALSAQPAGPRTTAAGLGAGVEKVWLDRTVEVLLDESIHQVGAPAAWDLGLDGEGITVAVLDTGIDPDHPDLAGRIVDSANFTDEPDITDGHGHGTHVASTVLGDGAASDGTFTGVAPAASLMVGKALGSSGTGQTSWVIEAMEWAAHNGADIVNLSLGSSPTDGTDPSSQALNNLTQETGALFVAATGNNFQDLHVLAPGAASSALTVGAVDRQDQVPFFSNRGPRRGDAAVKPEITAPGADIAAARAAGTAMGAPIDDHYTRGSGTSMATPHVAGAAALLAQANPDWDWQQLKDTLVSTAAAQPYQWWQGGTGRLDVERAATQQVSGPAAVSLGVQPYPQAELDPVHRDLTYRNRTGAAVTLALATEVTGWDGGPAGGLSLSADTVEVPAGGDAVVTLTVDPAADPAGVYGGRVVATSGDGEVAVLTGVSWYNEPEAYDVEVRVIGHRGGNPVSSVTVQAMRVDGANDNDPFTARNQTASAPSDTGVAQFRLPAGMYHFQAGVIERSAAFERVTWVTDPEVNIDRELAVTLDAREAVNQRPQTPEGTDVPAYNLTVIRGMPDGAAFSTSLTGGGGGRQEAYAVPSPAVSAGFLAYTSQWAFTQRLVDLTVTAPQQRQLDPVYDALSSGPLLASAPSELELVYVDQAEPEQIGDVSGKAALVRVPIPDGLTHPQSRGHAVQAARAARDTLAAAGAAAALIYVDIPEAPQLHGPDVPSTDLLTMTMAYDDGAQLRQLADQGLVTLGLAGQRDPSYAYHVRRDYEEIPAAVPAPIDPEQLVRMDTGYHGDAPDLVYESVWFPQGARDVFSVQPNWRWWGPTARTEYVGEPGEHLNWRRIVRQIGEHDGGFVQLTSDSYDVFRPGEHRGNESWFAAPVRTGAVELTGPTDRFNDLCENCRDGDGFVPGRHWLDGTAGHRQTVNWAADSEVRLFHGEQEIPPQTNRAYPWFLLPGDGTFRLERVDQQPGVPAVRQLAPQVRTTWTFHSAAPDAAPPAGYSCPLGGTTCAFQPLLVVDIDGDLGLTNAAPPPRDRRGPATVELRVRHHSGLDSGPAVAGARLWVSYDDGGTWRERPARDLGDGAYEFWLDSRDPADTSGYLSLRLEAWDVDGNRIEQEVTRAWHLPPPR